MRDRRRRSRRRCLLEVTRLEDRVTPTGNAPTALADVFAVHHGQSLIAQPLANDSDPENDPLIPELTSAAEHGYAYFDTEYNLHYISYDGWVGSEALSYRLFDGAEYSEAVTITVNVTNIAPVAADDAFSVSEDQSLIAAPLLNDSDSNGDGITPSIVVYPEFGSAYLDSLGQLQYTPNSDYSGADTLTYRLFDGAEYSESATITITVIPRNRAPEISTLVFSSDAPKTNDLLTASVTATDLEGDAITFRYEWYVNGQTVQTTITTASTDTLDLSLAGNGDRGDQIQLLVTAFDVNNAGSVASLNTTVANSTAVRNLGTGAIRLFWDQQALFIDVDASSTVEITGDVTGLTVLLLTSDATYQISTNGTLASISADTGVVGVQLSVDTTSSIGLPWEGSGDIGEILLPGGGSIYGQSSLDVHSRNDVGNVSAANGLGGILEFNNLLFSIDGFDHIDQLLASGWLGSDANSMISVNHGIDVIQAEGVWANVDTSLAYEETDPESSVTIGTGGILQSMKLGNVASFTDSGNVDDLQMVSLNGGLWLNGAILVNQLALGQAQNARIEAHQVTVGQFRNMVGASVSNRGYDWNFTTFAVGTIDRFILGTSTYSYRMMITGAMTVTRIGTMSLFGLLKAHTIDIGSIGLRWEISGVNANTPIPTPFDAYALYVDCYFNVGSIDDRLEAEGLPSYFVMGRSIYAPVFTVQNGRLQYFYIGGTDTARTYNFEGNLLVPNGGILDFKVLNAIQGLGFAEGSIITVNGPIERISANVIGSASRINQEYIQAPAIEKIELPALGFGRPSALYATIRATNGNITSVDAFGPGPLTGGWIEGDIIAENGDIYDVRAYALYGSIIAQRDRTNLNANNGGNIWRIEASGDIGRDAELSGNLTRSLIRADNAIASISAAYVGNNVTIILQSGASIQLDENNIEPFVIGGPLEVQVTTEAFLPLEVIFTYGIGTSTDRYAINLNVPAAWKIQLDNNAGLLAIYDQPTQPRVTFWFLSAPAGTILFPQGIYFVRSAVSDSLHVLAQIFDGDPANVEVLEFVL